MHRWAIVAGILICGYGLWGRTFAYVGIPQAKVFVGDVVLALFLVLCTNEIIHPWLANLIRPLPFSQLLWGLFLFLSYGVLQLARGLAIGYKPLVALQELVFNVYPLYFFLGLWAAISIPDLLHKLVRVLAVTGAVYGLIYYVFLRHVTVTLPGDTDLSLIPTPSGTMALIGLPCFERDLRRWWPVLGVSTFLVLASQIRAEWLSIIVVLALRSVLTRQFQHLLSGIVLVTAFLVIGFTVDFKIPSPPGRGGSVSSSEIVARAIAPFDYEAALSYSAKNSSTYAGTAGFRTEWWAAIWQSVHLRTDTAVLGYGYGYPLHDLVPYTRNTDLRTPHNVFFYALGYSGWLGVAVFYGFQGALGLLLVRVWRATGQLIGLLFWVGTLVGAHLGNLFETPFGAIPFYLMIGMAAAGLVNRTEVSALPKRYPLPRDRLGVLPSITRDAEIR